MEVSRPPSSTNYANYDLKLRSEVCLDGVTVKFSEMVNDTKKSGRYVKKGCLKKIIKNKKQNTICRVM